MKQPSASIIIPIYNVGEFLDRCIESAVNQTYKNIRIILVDDGSSDNSSEICDSWAKKDKRIKYKFLGENKGISQNTNKALDMTTGDFIALLDHDDMLNISALYEVVKVINENKEVEFIYTDEDKFHFCCLQQL